VELSRLIGAILSDHPAYADVRTLVDLCRRFALVYLRTRVKRTANPALAGFPIQDVATDCIAALFERSHTGVFTKLRLYFGKTAWQALSEEDLMVLLRRLVFSRVNQELCSLWKQGDPSLARIVRSLKSAVDKSPRLANCRIAAEPWVVLKSVNGNPDASQLMSMEFFEAHLSGALPEGMTTRAVVEKIADVFDSQEWYKKGLPLMDVAICVRNAFARAGAALAEAEESDPQTAEYHQTVLRDAVHNVQTRMEPSFVGRSRVDAPIYAAYFRAIYDALNEEYINGYGDDQSYFGRLRQQCPSIDAATFRREHKSHLEYLLRMTRENFLASLKELV
jgi:hypothetical protein